MTTLHERLQDFADDYPVTCDIDRKAVALLREAAAALRTKQPAGEDCENMIDPVQIKVSIPGQLGTTVRFVERSWLYPNN